jgi:four helix bundle protein
MRENVLLIKSFAFAVRIVRLYQFLCDNKKEFVLSKQLLRSGTSVGAMAREAEHSESKADFIHKLSISQKEINESIYWLELLKPRFCNRNFITNPKRFIAKHLRTFFDLIIFQYYFIQKKTTNIYLYCL